MQEAFRDIGIVMIATNSYLQHWFAASRGIDEFVFLDKEVRIHLFTDQPEEAQSWAKTNLTRVRLSTYSIPSYGWPEATLFRYKFITEKSENLKEHLLMYLDSDMLVIQAFDEIVIPENWKNGLGFVQHPGFFRPNGINGLLCRMKHPSLLKGDLYQVLKTGARQPGSWETRKDSSAFVKRNKRIKYVHGAVWFGLKESFIVMAQVLAENISEDLSRGMIAKWHDESHLNWYFAERGASILDCRLSYVPKYVWIKYSDPRILNVEKNVGEGRVPTKSNGFNS